MAEDLNQLRAIARRLVHADFQKPWEFRLVIDGLSHDLFRERDGGASDFDLLVKDIGYGPTTIETDAIKAGSITLTFPSGTDPTTMTLTMRDFRDRRFSKAFDAWCVSGDAATSRSVVNGNGTFNVPYGPNGYLRKVTRISLADPRDVEVWWMFPLKRGEITEAMDGEGFLEVPYTMVQFRSIEPDKFENLYPS